MIKIHLSTLLGKLKWNQAQLVRATGIRKNTVSDLFHEDAESVKLRHLDKICEVLECELHELMEYEREPKTSTASQEAEKPRASNQQRNLT